MLILSLESSSKVCSVALHRDGRLLSVSETFIEKSHSQVITLAIEQVLQFSALTLQEVNAVAVSSGPGSYTGLRIGVSTAKGICYGLDKPLIAVNTLHALARKAQKFYPSGYKFCPMIDARRTEVYAAVFDQELKVIKEPAPVVLDKDSNAFFTVEGKFVVLGDGAAKARNYLNENQYHFVEGVLPSAVEIGELASEKFTKGQFEDAAYFEPYYLKEFYTTSSYGK